MPFRCRQKLQSFAAGKIFYQVGTPNPDTGVVEFSDVPQQVELPSTEMTDLAACLKAGVSLEKTNCKLISPDTHALAERLNSFKEDSDSKSTETNSTETNPTTEDN